MAVKDTTKFIAWCGCVKCAKRQELFESQADWKDHCQREAMHERGSSPRCNWLCSYQ